MAEKKNPDYTQSAVSLCNPDEVYSLMLNRLLLSQRLDLLQSKLCNSELGIAIENTEIELQKLDTEIRQAIDKFGSYQDVETGVYAVKQRRESIAYQPELVRQYAPSKVASFVLIETVDSKALDALVKAGQLTAEDARRCGEVKESFAYIIK